MFKGKFGYSVYLSTYHQIKEKLPSHYCDGSYIFLSMHISEEYTPTYLQEIVTIIQEIKSIGYKIIVDVSKKTLEMTNYNNLLDLYAYIKPDYLRIDYGFSLDEINELAKSIPICLNASTITKDQLSQLTDSTKIIFMHNFYPRQETGLDEDYYNKTNFQLEKRGFEIFTFISSDFMQRGPLYEGLPTLEKHRFCNSYFQYLDLYFNFKQKNIIVGDGFLSDEDFRKIKRFMNDQVIEIEVNFFDDYNYLYDQEFTIRIDSPKNLKRLQESREYSCVGEKIEPFNNVKRLKGSITMDNKLYQRYSSEIMICGSDFEVCNKVNIIGNLNDLKFLKVMSSGCKIRFIHTKKKD